jgi:hypothetical protein
MDDDDDDDDIIFNAEGGHSKAVHLKDNPDAEYENEFGYALLKALRGKTVGRRLKRNIFKFGVLQLLCNFALLMIAIQACKWTLFRVLLCFPSLTLLLYCSKARNFTDTEYYDTPKFGATLLVSICVHCALLCSRC